MGTLPSWFIIPAQLCVSFGLESILYEIAIASLLSFDYHLIEEYYFHPLTLNQCESLKLT